MNYTIYSCICLLIELKYFLHPHGNLQPAPDRRLEDSTLLLYLKPDGMKIAAALLSLILILSNNQQAFAKEQDSLFDKARFYRAMESSNKELVDHELNHLKDLDFPDKGAYVGALSMLKASFPANPSKKLNLFKAGHKQLEAAIRKDSLNAEFRFLRLVIQENAPGMLGYRNDLEKDCDYIRKSFKTLPEVVQQAVLKYSRKSRILKPVDS